MQNHKWENILYKTILVAIYLFLIAPIIIVILSAFNSGDYLKFPPEGFSLKWFNKFFHSGPFISSLILSLKLAISSALTSTILGTFSAIYIVRYSGKSNKFLRPLIISPLLLPAILTGVALMFYFYQIGIGKSFFSLYIAHSLITVPYVFLMVSTVLYNFNYSLEEAARSLGAHSLTTFFKVTLPLIKGGVISGAVFAFITSFDQFPLSLVLTGPGFSTLPVQLFDFLRFEFDPTAAAVSTFNILIAFIIVLILQKFGGLKSLYGVDTD
jgi:putative spermidine/putrescine transport system permease protein